jgi:hypothetical protein
VVEQYPRLQNVQRMLGLIHQAITQAERGSNPGVTVLVAPGGDQAGVYLRVVGSPDVGMQQTSLAEELSLSGGETVGLFKWAESEGYIRPSYGGSAQISPGTEVPAAGLDHLETKGYELIGELPDPQERLALILEAAIRAVQSDDSLSQAEKKRKINWFEEAKFAVRTFGVEVAKAVWRGDLPPM